MTSSAPGDSVHSPAQPAQATKIALRRAVLARRRTRSSSSAAGPAEAHALARAVLGLPEVAGARTVAAYVSVGTEPPTAQLLDTLRARGTAVILPVLLPDGDLDWAPYEGPSRLTEGGATTRGLREPVGPPLGIDAVAGADVVVVPGLAAGADGTRLGRGGGSYDRALARIGPSAAAVLLLWEGEMFDEVPADAHDRRVDVVVTPSTVHRFTPRD